MRFLRFRRWLEEMLILNRPLLCVYEAATIGAGLQLSS